MEAALGAAQQKAAEQETALIKAQEELAGALKRIEGFKKFLDEADDRVQAADIQRYDVGESRRALEKELADLWTIISMEKQDLSPSKADAEERLQMAEHFEANARRAGGASLQRAINLEREIVGLQEKLWAAHSCASGAETLGDAQAKARPSVASDEAIALWARVISLIETIGTLKTEVANRAVAIDQVARVRDRVVAVRGESLVSLRKIDDDVSKGHREVQDSSQAAVGPFWERMAEVFKEEAERM